MENIHRDSSAGLGNRKHLSLPVFFSVVLVTYHMAQVTSGVEKESVFQLDWGVVRISGE